MIKRVIRSALALIMLALNVASCSGGGVSEDTNVEKTENTVTEAAVTEEAGGDPLTSGILKVDGEGYIVDGTGNRVELRGVNLGGWLLQETWMCAVEGSECNLDSIRLLRSRGFTEEQVKTLFMTYAENYITESDIKYLAKLGVNCVRLPFWYRNFMDDSLEFYSEDDAENPGFILVDRLVSWAGKYGIYVILDMHGCPGGQSTDHTTGQIGKNELYVKEENLDAMERLWVRIAGHYKESAAVCAYDVMNEPMNNNSSYEYGWPAGSDEAVKRTSAVYDRMIKAIREADGEHIITVEGIWSTDALPDPSKMGWTNMMYQLHLYDTSKEMIDYRIGELTGVRRKYKVAVYVGEFNNGDEQQLYAYDQYVKKHLSFTMWTYKVSKDYLGNWGILYAKVDSPDLKNDSYAAILRKWGTPLRSEEFEINRTVENWIKKFTAK